MAHEPELHVQSSRQIHSHITMEAQFAILCLLTAATAKAATLYCDPATGSPQGDGSAEHPWRTVAALITRERNGTLPAVWGGG